MTDVLESGRDPWQRPRWLLPLIVVLVLAGGVVGVALDRHWAAVAAERDDRPYRAFLAHLTAGADGPSDRRLGLSVGLEPGDEYAPPADGVMRVLGVDLEGVPGPVRLVVVNHFVGTGPGPLAADLVPFRERLTDLRVVFTLGAAAKCGRVPPGPPPPLLLTVELPSGKHVTQRVPILGPHVSTDFATGKRYSTLDWTHAMAEAACRPGAS